MDETVDRTTGCLFCGNEDGRFESEEHVVARALGNSVESGLVEVEMVLPPGVVCDKCNGRRLSRCDQALAGWAPVSIFRSLGVVRNRRGGLVDAAAGTRWRLDFDPDDRRRFRLHARGDTSAASGRDDVARALCKIAVESRWLQDPADARAPRWDAFAAAALGGPLPSGLHMSLTRPAGIADIDLTPEVQLMVDPASSEVRVSCQTWIVGLGLGLLAGLDPPPGDRFATWWTLDPATGALEGAEDMWAVFDGVAESAARLPADAEEAHPRRRSVLPTGDGAIRLLLQRGAPDRGTTPAP